MLRQFALKDLERVIEINPQFGEAHLLIGKLQALPGGDQHRAEKAANAAVRCSRRTASRRPRPWSSASSAKKTPTG